MVAPRKTWRGMLEWRDELARDGLIRLLREERGNVSAVARRIGIHTSNVWRLIRQLRLIRKFRIPLAAIRKRSRRVRRAK